MSLPGVLLSVVSNRTAWWLKNDGQDCEYFNLGPYYMYNQLSTTFGVILSEIVNNGKILHVVLVDSLQIFKASTMFCYLVNHV